MTVTKKQLMAIPLSVCSSVGSSAYMPADDNAMDLFCEADRVVIATVKLIKGCATNCGGAEVIPLTVMRQRTKARLTQSGTIGFLSIASSVTPAITDWTESGSPGGELALSGSALGPGLTVFVTGTAPDGSAFLQQAAIISETGSTAVIQLPDSLPSDTIYQVQAESSQGFSNAVLVNAPQLWWVGSNEVQPGQVTSLFGQNLVLEPSDHPTVTLTMTSGADVGEQFSLGIIDATSNRVDVKIPANLPQGTYSVQYDSGAGAGGSVAVSQTLAPVLTVNSASAGGHAVLNVASFGAVANDGQDDAGAFVAAMNAAQTLLSNGSGVTSVTVQLGAGEYDLSHSVGLPANVTLEGQGEGATELVAMPGFNVTGPNGVLWTEASNQGGSTNLANDTISNLTIDTNGNSTSTAVYAPGADVNHFDAIFGSYTDNLTISNVQILAANGTPVDVTDAQHFTLANSTIIGEAITLGSGSHILVYGNSFFGTDQSESNIQGFGAYDVALFNNTAQNLDPNATGQNIISDTNQGRFFVDQPQSGLGQNYNIYIAQNTTIGLAPFAEAAGLGVNETAGEQILFEGAGVTTQFSLDGLLKEASPLSLTLNLSSPNIGLAGNVGLLTIVSGTGAGETTEIAGYNQTTGTYYFENPLPVLPDATSVLQISQAPSQVAIINNTFDGRAQDVVAGATATASTGVEVYPGGSNVVINGNTFSNLNTGVSLWSFDGPNGSFIGANYFSINNNTFSNVNTGVLLQDGIPPPPWSSIPEPSQPTISAFSVTGTTIENNNFSGVNQTAINLNTIGIIGTSALNVTSQNIMPATTNAEAVALTGQLTGTAQLGSTVAVFNGSTLVGTTTTFTNANTGTGNWSLSVALPANENSSFTAVTTDGDGKVTAASPTLVMVVGEGR